MLNKIKKAKGARAAEDGCKTEWDFKLFYKSPEDPLIERDMEGIERSCEEFEKRYKDDPGFIRNAASLLAALQNYEELQEKAAAKPYIYFHYIADIDSGNEKALAKKNMLLSRITNAHNRVLFFPLRLGKVDGKKQQQFLKDSTLRNYHYFLKKIFENARYDLSEPEEKILNIKRQTSRDMWIDGMEKLLSKQMLKQKGREVSLPEASGILPGLPISARRKLHRELMAKLREVSDFAEAELNAVCTDKKISDDLRGFTYPYEATVLGYENDVASVRSLVATVTTHFPISERFYKLKAKLLKQNNLSYGDRSAVPGTISTRFDFGATIDLVENAFGKVDLKYAHMFRQFLKCGQVDVLPKKGKTGGAYCSSDIATPTMVLLNHTDDFRSVMTIAHEMGHAFHAELSKSQPIMYQSHTISVAEVASTLFENFVFEEVFEKLSPKEQVVALHSRLNDDVSIVFRQIACFNFENELHAAVRAEGFVGKERIALLMNKHMKAYMGNAVKFEENDGYFFVTWSHIRNFFYVYSYAYGQLISKALFAKYKQDPSFLSKIEEFLSAGGSKSPFDIFNDIGIDTGSPDFFEAGLRAIEADLDRLEKLSTK